MKRTIDLNQIVVRDIEGNPLAKDEQRKLIKQSAMVFYNAAKNVDDLELARSLNKLEPVEMTEGESERFKEAIKNTQSGFQYFWAYDPICKYIDSCFAKSTKEEMKEKAEKKPEKKE